MDERHLQSVEAVPGRFVDQLHPVGAQTVELRGEIGDLECDVMEARPALREESPHRRLGAERPKQLDPRRAHPKRRGLHALLLDGFPLLDRGAEEGAAGGIAGAGIVSTPAEDEALRGQWIGAAAGWKLRFVQLTLVIAPLVYAVWAVTAEKIDYENL